MNNVLDWDCFRVENGRVDLSSFDLSFPYNFGLHASEDEGRTEQPTEHRKRKARQEEGRVFLTQEFPQAIVVVVVFSAVMAFGRRIFEASKTLLVDHLLNPNSVYMSVDNAPGLVIQHLWGFFKFILPIGGLGVLAAVLATMVQTNFHVSTANLKIDFARMALSWNNFVKRTIFSRTQVLNLVKSYLKMFVVALVCFAFFVWLLDDLVLLATEGVWSGFVLLSKWTYQFIVASSVLFLLIAVPDWYVQRAEYLEQLKMSKEDIKKELRELDGSPEIAQRQKERARELANRSMQEAARKADVLITNPVHYACALRYDPLVMSAPKLVAKGADALARRLKQIAKEEQIPIVENKPLAQALYKTVHVNASIPPEFYAAVVEILRLLDKFKNYGQ